MTTIQEFDFTQKRKVNVPQTSRDAHESVKEDKQRMYDQIKEALEKMKVGGTSEEIAHFMGVQHQRVWKRLSEMDNIFDTGIRRKTSSGRKAMVRQLKNFDNNNI